MRLVVLMVLSITCGCSGELKGENICPETVRYLVNVTRFVTKNVQIRNYKWCANFPPRCSYYTEEERNVPEIVEKEEFRIIDKCCPGFEEVEENQTCITQCAKCQHGRCEFNKCLCDPGYEGKNCDTICPMSRWGKNCEFTCTCKQGACDPVSGHCTCYTGWKGQSCDEELSTSTVSPTPSTSQQISTTGIPKKSDLQLSFTPNRTKLPVFQKYHTFYITTENPQLVKTTEARSKIVKVPSSSNGRLTGITWLGINNITKTTQIPHVKHEPATTETIDQKNFVPITQAHPSNLQMEEKHVTNNTTSVKHTTFLLNEDDWVKNDTEEEFKNDLVIYHDQSPHLVFSVGAIIGITATIVFMIVALFITRIYVKQKPGSVISVVAKSAKSNDRNGVCIYTSSVFHAPLPDLPTFENPVFTTPVECEAKPCDFGSTIHTQVICSMQMPTHSTFRADSPNVNTFYDHPPSTGSYRAASVLELPPNDQNIEVPNLVEQREHLYDEIPCWKQPVNINNGNTDTLLSYYANCRDVS